MEGYGVAEDAAHRRLTARCKLVQEVGEEDTVAAVLGEFIDCNLAFE